MCQGGRQSKGRGATRNADEEPTSLCVSKFSGKSFKLHSREITNFLVLNTAEDDALVEKSVEKVGV